MLDPYFSDTTEWEEVIKGGYQQRGYHQERQNGHGRGRWRDREDPRLRRDDSIERRYNAPPSATSINATSFILCLSLYVRNIIEPIKEELQNLECFVKISKWLSWLVRHGKSLLHTSLSLTLSELFHFREFMQHTNSCLSYIARHPVTTEPLSSTDCLTHLKSGNTVETNG